MSRKKQVYEKITALYCRISLDDGGDNESMSISNQCSFDFDQQLFHQFLLSFFIRWAKLAVVITKILCPSQII